MNLTTKILLTYYVGGRLLGNRSSKLTKRVSNKSGRMVYENAPKEDLIQEKIPVKLNISEIAYDSMISESAPEKFSSAKGMRVWKSYSKKQRLEWHLSQIADGNKFQYEIIN